MRLLQLLLSSLCLLISGSLFAETCIECHQTRDKQVLRDWQQSGHASISCQDCHGSDQDSGHKATNARQNSVCTGCHEGSAEHSYRTSKHGVITGLEAKRTDWSKPLTRGNYRAPGCAYCHMNTGNHNTASSVNDFDPTQMGSMCSACHSPRYVSAQIAVGERLKNIAVLKTEEIKSIAQQAIKAGADKQAVEYLLKQTFEKGIKHIRLGSGHQSPDYQWWLGQPALDGLLIRMKGLYSEQLRVNK